MINNHLYEQIEYTALPEGLDYNALSLPLIFVSYAESDGPDLAEEIKDFLEKWGYDVFVARRDISFGEKWKKVIDVKLNTCEIFIILATLGTTKSNYVDYEVQKAIQSEKRIIPCKPAEISWKDLKWDIGEYEGVRSFSTTPELLRKLGPHILKNVGEIQHINLPLTVKTNKTSYQYGEEILVTGTVPAIIQGVPVAVQIFNPRNTMYTIDQVTPKADGTYSSSIRISGGIGIDGVYTIKATYSGDSVQTTFEYSGGERKETGIQRVEFQGITFNVIALLSNGFISSITPDPKFNSLILSVKTSEHNGELEITLPRELIDSRIGSVDDMFIVLVDGQEAVVVETVRTLTSRALKISIPAHAEEIEIIGTSLLPHEKIQENVIVIMISKGSSSPSNPRFYVPKHVRILTGTKVIWVSADTAGHIITSGNPNQSDWGKIFDSGFPLLKPTDTFEVTFNEKGEYFYFCQVHPWEVGKIVVD